MTVKKVISVIPYHQIGRTVKTGTPLFHSRVQTDGSFRRTREAIERARAAAILYTHDNVIARQTLVSINAENSTEADWASVCLGSMVALEMNQDRFGIENDNLGVIRALINPVDKLKHEYARHYRNIIYDLTKNAEWVGVRWIPREMNSADELFHMK